ncbi:UPF0764 protein C16orf89 homolog [Microplitis demolitor]|uniref:UPF0764 protein C16orf89 homolog n=1 Tax=Microplitis demolitor TaxID=69319 RepID=UPI0006D507B7|nr:UPF0764 protein C16orf89 homolog [Microplitis demolitor]
MKLQGCLLLWFLASCGPSWASELTPDYFDDITHALYKAVKFINERLDQVNIDSIFGLTLAEANLIAALSSSHIKFLPPEQWTLLNEIVNLCLSSRANFDKQLDKKNDSFTMMSKVLIQSDIWIHLINWQNGLILPYKYNFHSSKNKAASFLWQGSPQETESDSCLVELVEDNCHVSNKCADMLLKEDGSRGYPLTHRLLYVQAAKALQCKEHHRTNFKNLIKSYCRNILNDLFELEFNGFPSKSRDLIMEQIALCGMEGFSEFTNPHYGDLIIEWQNSFGCFKTRNSDQQIQFRYKRTSNPLDHGCDGHTIGVAAAALSILIREFIENNLNFNPYK